MSFSGNVKTEIGAQIPAARHCMLAELLAVFNMSGFLREDEKGAWVACLQTENLPLARKCFTLMEKTFNIKADIRVKKSHVAGGSQYAICWRGSSLLAIKNAMLQGVCCKRSYIRGAFMAAGSISDPEKAYHLEIVCQKISQAKLLQEMFFSFNLNGKIVQRKNTYVLYLKEGEQIVDTLNVMEAHVALMEFENIRIMKEMRNSVNRKVNCETANIKKTVSAAVRQTEDIELIRDIIGLEDLPENLREAAEARLLFPDGSLEELAKVMRIPVGKSGMNHRFRKLGKIADGIRTQQGGNYDSKNSYSSN